MGNTKYVSFLGDIAKGSEPFFTEQALLTVAHGDHVAVKLLHCYLHHDGEPQMDRFPFVIGHLTSHSMSGFNVIDHIVKYMVLGNIVRIDADYSDAFWLDVENYKITHRYELTWKERHIPA